MDQLETLKTKYSLALKTMTEAGVRLTNLHVQDGKLVVKGAAPSEMAKNEVWTAIKQADAKFPDITVELAVDSSLPVPLRGASYTVKSGDTLSKIAKEFYGSASEYMRIFEANTDQLKDPNMIKVGQVLRIPAK
jgi:nucleoid-associated protein YgaU